MSGDFEQIEIPDLNDLSLASPNVDANDVFNEAKPEPRYNNQLEDAKLAAAQPIPEDEEKPTAEYALHILFTRFVRYTEKKLAILQSVPEDAIEAALRAGADPEFDLILESLGHVSRRRPKPVIDSIMYWRKTKREQASISLASLYVLCRALMEVIRQTPHDVLGNSLSEKLEEIVFTQLISADPEIAISNGIRSANWRYLARLLGEMSSFRLASVDDRFIAELEKKNLTRAQEIRASVLLEAMQYLKIKLYPEEFLEESSAFLESVSKFYTNTPFVSPLRDKYAEAISHILEPLAEAITVEVNQPMWASTMETLFKASQEKPPVTGLAGRTASVTNQFAGQTFAPSCAAFSLSVMSLCLSPQPIFSANWFRLLEANVQKQKTKQFRTVHLLSAAARLTWVYIFRCSESLNLTTKKIEALRKLFLSSTNRKYWQSVDADAEARTACISLLRSCFQGYQQYTLDELLFPMLIGADATSLAQQHAIAFDSSVLPERAGIAVDAFVEMMGDLKSGMRPPFPSNRSNAEVVVPTEGLRGAKISSQKTELPHQPQVSAALQASIDLFGTCIGQVSQWLEQGGGTSKTASRQNSVSHLVSFASGGNSNNNPQVEGQKYEAGIRNAEQQLLLLFVRSWPSWWTPEQHLRNLDVLCKCVGHSIVPISEAAVEAFRKLAQTCDLRVLFAPYTKAMMAADARTAEAADLSTLSTSSSGPNGRNGDVNNSLGHSSSFSFSSAGGFGLGLGLGLHTSSNSQDLDSPSDSQSAFGDAQSQENFLTNYIALYVELVEIWISRLQNGDPAISGSQIDSQLFNLWSVVEEIEGNGLFFLCSQDMRIRSLGLRILWLTTSMDQAFLNYQELKQPGKPEPRPSRIINLLQDTPIAHMITLAGKRFELSMPERNRLAKFRSKRASLARLAESSYGVDSALWLKLFPVVITLCFETHPMTVALCRNLVSDRLVQMHEVVAEISAGPGSSLPNFASVAIVEQWKIYLIVACATMTITEEQKLYVPSTSMNTVSSTGFGTMHSRKRSHQKITLHHQRITSARSVFRIVTPMLRSEKNAVRECVVAGLSCTNVNTYKPLLECLQPILTESITKLQQIRGVQPKAGATGMYDMLLRSVTCITQVLKQTTIFLENEEIRKDIWIRTEVVSVLHQLRDLVGTLKSLQDVTLQISFCELLADTYTTLRPSLMFLGRNPVEDWHLFWKTIEMWSPHGANAAAVLEHRLTLKRRAANDVVLAQMEIVKRDLDRATSRALAALLLESQQFIKDLSEVLHWIYALLAANADTISQDTGRVALENLLVSHASRSELLQEVVNRCYHNSSERSRGVAKVYFVALVNMFETHPDLIENKVDKPQQFLALALFKIGDPDCETRFKAVKLLELVENGLYGSSVIGGEYQFRLRSTSPSVYKREIFVLSGKLAAERTQESFYLFSQMTRAFQAVNDSDRKDILSVLLPWIQNIEFKEDDGGGLQMVLVNLLEITTVFSGKLQHEVEALWIALCASATGVNNNALRILDFLLSFCLQHRTPGTISVSRTVLIYLLSSPSSSAITEKLLSYLEPSHMITQSNKGGRELLSHACAEEYPYVASLSDIVALANEKEGSTKNVLLPPFSYGQLAVVFLVDTISTSAPVQPRLASLVHACVVLGDHFVALVQDKTRKLLLNLAGMFNPEPVGMNQFTELLGNLRWRYEDDSGAVPDQVNELVSALLTHLGGEEVLDHREWAQVALHWATTSPVRHVACRSLQIYRCLDLHLDTKMLGDLLARLSSTISEQAADIQGFASQILMTLNAIIDKMDANMLSSHASLFWASVASLSTANEREYIEALSAVGKLLTKWSPNFAAAAIAVFPSRWEYPLSEFPGILPLVLRGLRSQNAAELSHSVIQQLIVLAENASESDNILLFGGRSPLPELLASSLPWLLHAMDQPHLATTLTQSTQSLQRQVTPLMGGLARILDSFVKRRLWSRSDFLRQYVLSLSVAFPEEVFDVMILIMSMVNNSLQFVRRAALDILRIFVPEIDIHRVAIPKKLRGADLIAPLLRLLTTPDVEDALSVLDIVASVRPDRMDKDVLRMTLGSRQLFHEYENTETLFGIPDESGWSVPMPAQAATTTRANIHAVFYACISAQPSAEEDSFGLPADNNMQVQQFQIEEYAPMASLYRRNSEQASVGHLGMESMNKILADLDEFDSFFTQVAGPQRSTSIGIGTASQNGLANTTPKSFSHEMESGNEQHTAGRGANFSNMGRHASTPPRQRSTSESESIPQLYDKKVSLILNQSLARTPSQVSFRTSFADSFSHALPTASTGGNSAANLGSVAGGPGPLSTNTMRPSHVRRQSSNYSRALYGQGLGEYSSTSLTRTQSHASENSTTATIADSRELETSIAPTTSLSLDSSTENRSAKSTSTSRWKWHESQPSTPIQRKVDATFRTGHLDNYDFFGSPVDTSPSKSPGKKKSKKSGKAHQESSFRLESLLGGKRKSKAEKEKADNSKQVNLQSSPNGDLFQFPPRS